MAHYFTNEENLKSEIKKVHCNINEQSFYFYTDNGVFSKGELDYGTELLINTFENSYQQQKNILDMGCGCGPIGIYFSKLGYDVDMCDINKRALHLTKRSLKEQNLSASVIESDCYSNIINKYDFIITNPPIKAGKEILYNIVMKAKEYLNPNGELWLVIRKDKGALSLMRDMKEKYSTIEIMNKKKGFFIIKAK